MVKNKKLFIIVALIGVAVMAYVNQQKTEHLINRLQAEGFRTDQRIASDPILLIDRTQRQLAVVYPDRSERIQFSQLSKISTELDVNHKDQEERLVRLSFNDPSTAPILLEGSTPEQVQQWKQLLQALVFNP